MQTCNPKVKRLPFRNVTVTRDGNKLFRKKGYHYSQNIDSLMVDGCDYRSTRKFRKLIQFKSFKKISYSLQHGIRESSSISNQEINQLSALFKKMNYKRLEFLNLYMLTYASATDLGIGRLLKSIRRFSNLKTLLLSFKNLKNLDGYAFESLKSSLRRILSLENFKIHVEPCNKFTSEGLKILSDSFNELNPKTLTNLRIGLIQQPKDLKESFVRSIAPVQKLSNLKSLYLNLYQNTVPADALETLMSQLAKTASLEQFGVCGLGTPESHNVLCQGLEKLDNLKSIHFKLHDLIKPNFICLSQSLSKLSSLEEIRLTLTYPSVQATNGFGFGFAGNPAPARNPENEIDDACLSEFCKALQQHSSRLKVFDLSLGVLGFIPQELPITNVGLCYIDELLASCTQLQVLHLILANGVDNKALEILSNTVQKQKKLKSLFFSLFESQTEKVSDHTFKLFLKSLASSPNLKELSIFFANFSLVTDESVISLSESLSQLNSLQLVNLQLLNFPNVTSQCVKNAITILKESTTLETANLKFSVEKGSYQSDPKVSQEIGLDKRFSMLTNQSVTLISQKISLQEFEM